MRITQYKETQEADVSLSLCFVRQKKLLRINSLIYNVKALAVVNYEQKVKLSEWN